MLDFFSAQNFEDLAKALDDAEFADMPPLVPRTAIQLEEDTSSPHSEEAMDKEHQLKEALEEDPNLVPSHGQKVASQESNWASSYPKVELYEILKKRVRGKKVLDTDTDPAPVGAIHEKVEEAWLPDPYEVPFEKKVVEDAVVHSEKNSFGEEDEEVEEGATGPWIPDPCDVPYGNETTAGCEKDSLIATKIGFDFEKDSFAEENDNDEEEAEEFEECVAGPWFPDPDEVPVGNENVDVPATATDFKMDSVKKLILGSKKESAPVAAIYGEVEDATTESWLSDPEEIPPGNVEAFIAAAPDSEKDSLVAENGKVEEGASVPEKTQFVEKDETLAGGGKGRTEMPGAVGSGKDKSDCTASDSGTDSVVESGQVLEKATEKHVLGSGRKSAPGGAIHKATEVGATDEILLEGQVVEASAVLPENDSHGKETVEVGAAGPWFPDPEKVSLVQEEDLAIATVAGSEKYSLTDTSRDSGKDSLGKNNGKVEKTIEKLVLGSDNESVPDGAINEKFVEGSQDSLGGAEQEGDEEGATGPWFPDPDEDSLGNEEAIAEATAGASEDSLIGGEKGEVVEYGKVKEALHSAGIVETPTDKGKGKKSQNPGAAGGEKDKEHYDPSDSFAQFYKCLQNCIAMDIEDAGLPSSTKDPFPAKNPPQAEADKDPNAEAKAEFARMSTTLGPPVIHPQVLWHQTMFYVEFRVSSVWFP